MSIPHDSPSCAQRLTSTKPDTQGTHLTVSKIHALRYSFLIALLSNPPWRLTPPSPFSVTGKASQTNVSHSSKRKVFPHIWKLSQVCNRSQFTINHPHVDISTITD